MATPTQACNRCHKLHVKCGGGIPCERCLKKGHECILLEHKKKRKEVALSEPFSKRVVRKSNVSKVLLCQCGFVFESEGVCPRCCSPVAAANSVDYIVDQLKKLKHAGVSASGRDYWASMKIISCSNELRQFLAIEQPIGCSFAEYLDPSALVTELVSTPKKDLILPLLRNRKTVSHSRCLFTVSYDGSDAGPAVEVIQIIAIDLSIPLGAPSVAGALYDHNDNLIEFVPSREIVSLLPYNAVPPSLPRRTDAFAFPVAPPPVVAQALASAANHPFSSTPPPNNPHWPLVTRTENLYGFDNFDSVLPSKSDDRINPDRTALPEWNFVHSSPSYEDSFDDLKRLENFEEELEELRSLDFYYMTKSSAPAEVV